MNYYIHNSYIHITEAELDYNNLTSEQINFFLENKNASVSEILNCKLNKSYTPTKEELIEILSNNYANVERKNLTGAGAVQLKEWAECGNQFAIDNIQWLKDLYSERDVKIMKLYNNEIVEELMPSENLLTKPHSFFDINKNINI